MWLKVCFVLSNIGGSEESQLWVVIIPLKRTSCDVWQLKCQTSNVTASVQTFSTQICRIVHHTVLKFSHCRKPQHVHINTCTPPVACPRRSIRTMQVIGSTKQRLLLIFFWAKANNDVWISQGKVSTSDRWDGRMCKIFIQIFSGFNTRNY